MQRYVHGGHSWKRRALPGRRVKWAQMGPVPSNESSSLLFLVQGQGGLHRGGCALPPGGREESRELFLPLLVFRCLRLKTNLPPKRHVLIPCTAL